MKKDSDSGVLFDGRRTGCGVAWRGVAGSQCKLCNPRPPQRRAGLADDSSERKGSREKDEGTN